LNFGPAGFWKKEDNFLKSRFLNFGLQYSLSISKQQDKS